MQDISLIRAELGNEQPQLLLIPKRSGEVLVTGDFLLWDQGQPYDAYKVNILIPPSFPRRAPIVKEVGGRIPWDQDRHVDPYNGTTCLYARDEEFLYLKPETNFVDFLNGPIRSFFFSQRYFEQYGEWPFGQRSHGYQGLLEFYREQTGVHSFEDLYRLLKLMLKKKQRPWYRCFCGRRFSDCSDHHPRVMALQKRVKRKHLRQTLQGVKAKRPASRLSLPIWRLMAKLKVIKLPGACSQHDEVNSAILDRVRPSCRTRTSTLAILSSISMNHQSPWEKHHE